MRKQFIKKKGLSPVVTTVLLIVLVIVIIGIIFLWFRGMVEEGVTKFGKNIQLVCDDVNFDASYSSEGSINIVNKGSIPLYRVNLRIGSGGSYETMRIEELIEIGENENQWPNKGLIQGQVFSGGIQDYVDGANMIKVFPILIGTSGNGKKTFICEGEYGKEISI
jgi:flagellin-like protein